MVFYYDLAQVMIEERLHEMRRIALGREAKRLWRRDKASAPPEPPRVIPSEEYVHTLAAGR